MSTCILELNLLQNTIELFVQQLIILNKKIDTLEYKINHIHNITPNHITPNIINNHITSNHNIDWDSIHLY